MDILPKFQAGILNGWIPLMIYFIGLIFSVSLYSKDARTWLFNNPKDTHKHGLIFFRLFGQFLMMAYIVMLIFSPLKTNHPVFLAGAGVFMIGFIFEMSALHYFRKTQVGQAVVKGPYRLSRNPQWLGLFFVLLGSAIAAGVWLYIGIMLVVGFIYHIQILDEETACLQKYGENYREYMNRIPRYLLFF
jgi:protein-S-isoprenylcysteine O-methyltransferase Ste14